MGQPIKDKSSDEDNAEQTSVLFEDETEIYELIISDNFLENLSDYGDLTKSSTLSEGYEFTSSDFLSDEDIFGPSITEISSEINQDWIAALTAGTDFDFDLAYSSHELLTLDGNNTIYDTSTSNSLIITQDGLQDISTGSKTTDIFVELGSTAKISGDLSTVNLFVSEQGLKDIQFEGHFDGIEFNLLIKNSETIPEVEIEGDKLLLKGDNTQEIDFSNTEFVLSGVNVNFYSSEGLVDTQTLGPIFNEQGQKPLQYSQSEIDAPDSYTEQLLFEDDVEIIQMSNNQTYTTNSSNESAYTFGAQGDDHTDFEIKLESQINAVEEASLLLEAETLFMDPLDVFSDEDFL